MSLFGVCSLGFVHYRGPSILVILHKGFYRVVSGYTGFRDATPRKENQMEKTTDNELAPGVIHYRRLQGLYGCIYSCLSPKP